MRTTTNKTEMMDKYKGLMNFVKISLTANQLRIQRKSVSWDFNTYTPKKS